MKIYNSKIIIACDFNSKKELYRLIKQLKNKKLFLKLGMQLIYKEGFSFIKDLKNMGHNIFIDLKIYDIPNTAKNAVLSIISSCDPDFLTIHSLNSEYALQLMQNSVESTDTKLLAVTILTSMSQQDIENININVQLDKAVENLVNISSAAGIWGIVSSANESHMVKLKGMKSITPGIRLGADDNQDQKRIMTPYQAIKNGADFIVVGRTITQSKNILSTYEEIEKQITKAEEEEAKYE